MKTGEYTFVAGNIEPRRFRSDPSFVYRCENLGRTLEARGQTVELVHLKNLAFDRLQRCVVFHRPRASARLARILRQIRRQGATAIAEFDDLVFDEAYHQFSPAVMNRQTPRWMIRRRFRSHQAALAWFDGVTVATKPLAEHVNRLFPDIPVAVIPNCVHRDWQHVVDDQVAGAKTEKVITYFPGTRSHDRDFLQIQDPLTRFLQENPTVRLQITGPLAFDIAARPGQVKRLERVSFKDYRELVRGSWLNLAPLESTPFTRCKSGVKVIEAAWWKIPTLCSPIPDTERLVGAGAILAATPGDWLHQLRCMLDPAQYQQVTTGLTQRILALADIEEQASRFELFADSLA